MVAPYQNATGEAPYTPARYGHDTDKHGVVNAIEYEEFIQRRENELQNEIIMDEEPGRLLKSMGGSQKDEVEADEETGHDAESKEESELYNEFLKNFRKEIFGTASSTEHPF